MKREFASSGLLRISALVLISFSLILTSCSKEELLIEPSATSRMSSVALNQNAQPLPELFGMYTTPTNLTIGNAASEMHFFSICKTRAVT